MKLKLFKSANERYLKKFDKVVKKINALENEIQCKNLMTYINTKFFHFLVTLQKNTMMAPKSVYSFVPMQDLSKPWNDKELYEKYKLSEEEIKFIESMVRPEIGA